MFRLFVFIVIATFTVGSVNADAQERLAAATPVPADLRETTNTNTSYAAQEDTNAVAEYYTPPVMRYNGQNEASYSDAALVRADGPPTRLNPTDRSQDEPSA